MNPFAALRWGWRGWVCQHGFPDSVVVITPNDQENLGSNLASGQFRTALKTSSKVVRMYSGVCVCVCACGFVRLISKY